mmetsp:Transcript_13383/g.39432  ORF Transcript_13383/g.39432 Transcript_13383/m.39432 type:complete len:286 (-) Transcript_13383:99-956(-)
MSLPRRPPQLPPRRALRWTRRRQLRRRRCWRHRRQRPRRRTRFFSRLTRCTRSSSSSLSTTCSRRRPKRAPTWARSCSGAARAATTRWPLRSEHPRARKRSSRKASSWPRQHLSRTRKVATRGSGWASSAAAPTLSSLPTCGWPTPLSSARAWTRPSSACPTTPPCTSPWGSGAPRWPRSTSWSASLPTWYSANPRSPPTTRLSPSIARRGSCGPRATSPKRPPRPPNGQTPSQGMRRRHGCRNSLTPHPAPGTWWAPRSGRCPSSEHAWRMPHAASSRGQPGGR